MIKHMLHECCGPDGKPDPDKMTAFMERQHRSNIFDVIGWGLFFIWVGVAWLMKIDLGWVMMGIGVLTLAVQLARAAFHVHVDGFWIVVGLAFIASAFWELWSLAVPLAPFALIALGIGLLVWYCTKTLTHRKRMF